MLTLCSLATLLSHEVPGAHSGCEHDINSQRAYGNMRLTPTSQLLSLPTEIVEHVIEQVSEKTDLSNIRLTCSTLDKYAANELFKDVFVTPAEEHVNAWNNTSQHNAIRRIPCHTTIQSQPDFEDDDWDFDGEDRVEAGEEFEAAVAALAKFPKLDSLEVAFTPQCNGEKGFSVFGMEKAADREKRLQTVFEAINNRATDENNRTIRKLTIINLQNYPPTRLHFFGPVSQGRGTVVRAAHRADTGNKLPTRSRLGESRDANVSCALYCRVVRSYIYNLAHTMYLLQQR